MWLSNEVGMSGNEAAEDTHVCILPHLLLPAGLTSRLPLLRTQLQLCLKGVSGAGAAQAHQTCLTRQSGNAGVQMYGEQDRHTIDVNIEHAQLGLQFILNIT